MSENIWEGERVRLRAWEPEDWQHQTGWYRDTEGDRRTYFIPFPASQAWTRKDAEEMALHRPKNDDFHFMIETLEKVAAGVISTPENDLRNGTCSFGIYVAPEHRRKGYAREAIQIMLRYFFFERALSEGRNGRLRFQRAIGEAPREPRIST